MTLTPLDVFDRSVAVFGGPGRYVQGPDTVDLVGRCAATLGKRVIFLADDIVFDMLNERVEIACKKADIAFTHLPFNGELGRTTGQELVDAATLRKGDVIVAAGGGRAIDAGKAVVELTDLPLITLPTVASNDAPTSKNFVLYDADHVLLEVRHLFRNPDYVIADTRVLAAAPGAFFLSGLGDAIVKKFEADCCAKANGVNMFGARPTFLAGSVAQVCYDVLIEHGAAAQRTAGTGTVTPEFEAAVEAMILMAGLGFESGGLSITHALTRGLSLVHGAKDAAHGLQVAYGLMVQLMLEGRDPPDDLVKFYADTGLPRTLNELGVKAPGDEEFRTIAEATVGVKHMANFSRTVNEDQLIHALTRVEGI